MHQFVEQCIDYGFIAKNEYYLLEPYHIKGLFIRLAKLFFKNNIRNRNKKRNAIIVTANGSTLFRESFPYFYSYEIIPMLWDVWPGKWDILYKDIIRLNCNLLFVTVRSMANKISQDLGIKAYWIPEGIDLKSFNKGADLKERHIDLYEMGRQMLNLHVFLVQLFNDDKIKGYYRNLYNKDGSLSRLAFETTEEMQKTLSDIKIVVSFPQCDTHPQIAGNLETLTQRYWEAMLCRCLIIGRAPQELIDLIGYDPVVNIDWNSPSMQIEEILKNIDDYQLLVDKNYNSAIKFASWEMRIREIRKILLKEKYIV
jgi:glycosyltransferase involved in cell wall biosynthesis